MVRPVAPEAAASSIKLPLRTMEEFQLAEAVMRETPCEKQKMILTFSLIGGHTAEEAVRRMLQSGLTNNLACRFNWAGKGFKEAFKSTVLSDVLFAALQKQLPGTTHIVFSGTLKKWLKYAPEREGGGGRRTNERDQMSRAKADEDDYWNSSKFTLAFTFDEEDDDYTRLKESKKAVNSISALADEDDDDDDVEKVSWSGEPVGSISWSVKETASKLRPAGDSRELGFPKISASPSLPKNNSVYSLSSLFKAKTKVGGMLSSSDSFSDTPARHYAPELRKPKCEYKDYISNWSPQETILKMQQGKVVSLERFQSLQDKMLLLDKAVDGHDGNIITAILIYLKRSLCKEVLFRELVGRETALRHYIHYLKESGEQKVLLDLFRALGRTEDEALLQYKHHLTITDESKRRDFLKTCLGLPFSPEDSLHVQDHYTLLERQIIIEENDKQVEKTGQSDVFKRFPRKASILNMPLITTLYYSCFYHYSEPEGTYSSPANIRRTFKLAEKQYFLTALAARAKLKAWTDVDSLFTTRNWLGFTKKKSPVAFQRVLDILHKNNAPVQVLEVYVNLLEDLELKINMAHKFKCHDVIINTYRDTKDKKQLLGYQKKFDMSSAEHKKIADVLNNSQIRWKN